MNIFILDDNPKLSAQYHTNKHVVKMILEQTQILCTVLNKLSIQVLYKPTHINHPCTLWAEYSLGNFLELLYRTECLIDEYYYKYKKKHKCDIIINSIKNNIKNISSKFNNQELTPFAQAMPDKYKNINAVKAYRDYYNNEKRHLFRWSKYRKMPYWIEGLR